MKTASSLPMKPRLLYFHTAVNTIRAYGIWAKLASASKRTGLRPPTTSQPRLLLLAWVLPPMITGGVYRPLSLMREAVRCGWAVTAVSRTPQSEPAGVSLASLIPSEVNMLRVDPVTWKPSWRFFPSVDGGFMNALAMISRVRSELVAAPDVVLASGPPFHTFIAARYLSRLYGAKLVLDYRDEWTQCPFDFVQVARNDLQWEARCLSEASLVVFTTQSQKDKAEQSFRREIAGKAIVIPNGWNDALGDAVSDTDYVPNDGHIQLSFLGNLEEHSFCREFLDDFKKALTCCASLQGKVKLSFVGKRSPALHSLLTEEANKLPLYISNQVPLHQARQMMHESSALLLFSNPDLARYIPGKLYEYAASGRPIIVYGYPGEVFDVVSKYDLGASVAPGNPELLARAILGCATRDNKLPPQKREWLHRHARSTLAREYISQLSSLIDAG